MRNLKILLISILFLAPAFTCFSQVKQSNEVKMYYFHFTRRCATCIAVEEESKKAITELYGDKVSFLSVNLEEDEGMKKGENLGISGQTLLIVSGDNKINITNEGFMNARSNPEKLKQIIKDKMDPLVN